MAFVNPKAFTGRQTYRSVIHITRGITKRVIPANGRVASVAPIQTHRPDINPANVIRMCQSYKGSRRLTVNEFVLGYFIPSVPDGPSLLKVVDGVCGRKEHGGPQKETGDG